MSEWTGKNLAEHLITYHNTRDPLTLASIYGFAINKSIVQPFPSAYVLKDNGSKEIMIDSRLNDFLIDFHVGKQLFLFLLEHPDQIQGVDENG